jgi:DNA-binding transcriptional ArsR family regulator
LGDKPKRKRKPPAGRLRTKPTNQKKPGLTPGQPRAKLNQLVKYPPPSLDRVFSALSDPIRREIVERLSERELTVSEIAGPYNITLPATTKHLHVLEDAGLVRSRKEGRVRTCELIPNAMDDAEAWMRKYRRFWNVQLDALDRHFTSKSSKETP